MLIIADTGAIISLSLVGQLPIIEKLFGKFYIPNAVFEELQNYGNPLFDERIIHDLSNRVVEIKSENYLSMLMDYGESESVILYKELEADYLLIDDSKARSIAESLDIVCIGSVGILIRAKQKGLIVELRSIFEFWLANDRHFSKKLLNQILKQQGESLIT